MTYPELAQQRELAQRRAAQNAALQQRHAEFDLSAKDNHMKYERPSFVVVTASEAFRGGYDRIDWKKDTEKKNVDPH